VGCIAARTTFIALVDLLYRRADIEHAAASVPNLLQTVVLICLLALVVTGMTLLLTKILAAG
jgi:cation:H+ antiporter